MNSPAKAILICLLFLRFFSANGQSAEVSLQNELRNVKTDTGRISILIDLAYRAESNKEALKYSYQAFLLGKHTSSIRHKSRSEVVHGSFLSKSNLDSGIALIKSGIRGYEQAGMLLYTANGFYILGQTYDFQNQYNLAISCYEKTFEIASENEFYQEWGDAAYELSVLSNLKGNNVDAIKWANEALEAFETDENRELEIADVLNQIGIIYDQKGLYPEAINSYLKAKEYAKMANSIESEILIENNIGALYDNMNDTETAKDYFSAALEKARIHNLKDDEATFLNNLSFIHQKEGDTTLAIKLLRSALAIDVSDDAFCYISYPLEARGSLHLAMHELDSAEILLNQALEVSKECGDVAMQSSIYKSIGRLYLEQGEINNSRSALNKALMLARKAELPTETKEVYLELSTFFEKTNELDEALNYLKKYLSISNSLSKANNIEGATRLISEYEFRKKISEIEEQQHSSEQLLYNQIKSKATENRVILIALGILLIMAVILIRAYAINRRNIKKLAAINEEKNRLIGVVAHDLRNPLNMMKGLLPFLEESKDEVKDPYYPQYLDMLNLSAEKMLNMIERVLDISAIENMKLNLKMTETDLNELTLKSIRNFDHIAGQKMIKIVNNIDLGNAHISIVDPNYLEQVIDNLISNAIKFSEKGKQIIISLANNGSKNLIEVKDEGPGISEEDQKSIFQAFQTSSTKPTEQERSTGLGLSIAMKFVKAMNGEIDIQSRIGSGTAFTVSFVQA